MKGTLSIAVFSSGVGAERDTSHMPKSLVCLSPRLNPSTIRLYSGNPFVKSIICPTFQLRPFYYRPCGHICCMLLRLVPQNQEQPLDCCLQFFQAAFQSD